MYQKIGGDNGATVSEMLRAFRPLTSVSLPKIPASPNSENGVVVPRATTKSLRPSPFISTFRAYARRRVKEAAVIEPVSRAHPSTTLSVHVPLDVAMFLNWRFML